MLTHEIENKNNTKENEKKKQNDAVSNLKCKILSAN